MRERLVHGEDAPVVLRLEVLEVVHAAPREERFPRIGGIGAVERLGEEGVQSEAGGLAQCLGRPAGKGITVAGLGGAPVQGLGIERGQLRVETLHHLEVVREGAELGRAAQVELHA